MQTVQPIDFRNRPVGDVVGEDYRRAAVFKRFGIDFCCGGGRTVQAACDKKGVAYADLEAALLAAERSAGGQAQPDARGWDLGFLADYIVNVHHRYVLENLPVLVQFASKVARVHGDRRPELVGTSALVEELAAELDAHMMKEERVLFPHIKALVEASKRGTDLERPSFGSVRRPIAAMEHEHDHAGELMRRIRALTDGFTPPQDACNTYRALFAKLEEFEEDLHRHVHLENNVLFPRAAALEDELAGTSAGASAA